MYDRISHRFDSCHFLTHISKSYGDQNLIHLQGQLLNGLMEMKDLRIKNVDEGILLIRSKLSCRKTLLVLDDVDGTTILEALVGSVDWFGEGSRVIITTRDERICTVDQVYKVELLNNDEARRLFCRIAFRSDYSIKGYEELMNGVLEYAKGLPLAIKSLALLLFHPPVSEWTSDLAHLQKFLENAIIVYLEKVLMDYTTWKKNYFWT